MYKSGSSGMKRERLGVSDSPPPSSMSKRSRSNNNVPPGRYADPDSSDDNASPPPPENRSSRSLSDRHHPRSTGGGGSRSSSRNNNMSPRGGGPPPSRYDDYSSGGGGGGGGSRYKEGSGGRGHHSSGGGGGSYQYKVLCISNLHAKASDEVIRDTLYREFKRFGDISVKVVHEPEERLAFVYFRSAEDAREAKHSKSRIIVYDKPVVVEAAYESAPTAPPPSNNYSSGGGGGGRSSSMHHSPPPSTNKHHHHDYDSGKMYRRSPVFEGRGRDDRYDRYDSRSAMAPPPGPLPGPMHYNNNNRDYGGGSRGGRGDMDHHHHHPYPPRNLPPPPGGGNGPMHYSRYPPGGSGPMGGGPRGQQPPPPQHSAMPPVHHHPGMDAPPGGPHHMGPPMGGVPPGGGPGGPRYENKKDKFPNYLHHIAPEEDPLATRTLFAGNLEVNITDEELRRIFGRYGVVEDIDIKRPPPGTGNAYAFVRFVNLDMASRAKCELSGQYIGKFQCKIGYGKVNATTKIWVGGLGPWTTLSMLEREFDRFGSIKKIDWAKGEIVAYITYETIDAAQAAVKDMRGYPLGGPDKKLRTDFADAGAPLIAPIASPGQSFTSGGGNKRDFYEGGGGAAAEGGDFEYRSTYNKNNSSRSFSRSREEPRGGDGDGPTTTTTTRGGPGSTHSGGTDLGTSPGGSDSESAAERPLSARNGGGGLLSAARNIQDISKRAALGWSGALILKNSSFPTKLYMTEGELEGVDSLMRDEDGKTQLRITQRLRLDQTKLDDVIKRISSSSAHGVFLAMPGSSSSNAISSPSSGGGGGDESSGSVQTRPLRNLVSYLKQKEAAGVISLVNAKDTSLTGVLYAFPPCPFSWDLLKKNSPQLTVDSSTEGVAKEDHLVIVVIRGGTA